MTLCLWRRVADRGFRHVIHLPKSAWSFNGELHPFRENW